MLYSPEAPAPLGAGANGEREMATLNNLAAAGVQRMGHLSDAGAGGGAPAPPPPLPRAPHVPELEATAAVADELARVVWDLSAAAEQNPGRTTQDDLRLLEQMANDAKELQGQLMQQLSSYDGGDERVFEAALESNDALQNVLSGYEDILMRVTMARHSAAAGAAAAAAHPSRAGADAGGGAVAGAVDPTNMSEEEIIRRLEQQSGGAAPPLPDLIRMDSATDISALAGGAAAPRAGGPPVVVHGTAVGMMPPPQPQQQQPQQQQQQQPFYQQQFPSTFQ